MAWRSGSLSRSLISSARASTLRSNASSFSRIRPPPLPAPSRPQSRRFSFSASRHLGELGCTQSLLPINMMVVSCLTSHLAVKARACCELSHGTFCRTCQDR